MVAKKIFFVSTPSPLLGRPPASFSLGIFGLYSEKKFIAKLQSQLLNAGYEWEVMADNTESDIEQLIHQGADLLICAPGLRFQFYLNGFDSKKVIYLSTMDYATNNANPVISKIKELYDEEKP